MEMVYICHCDKCGYINKIKDKQVNIFDIEEQEIHLFLENHPDGQVELDTGLYQCEKCKRFVVNPTLSMYIPDKKNASLYRLSKRYKHICKDCSSKMIRIDGKRRLSTKAICPKCGEHLYIDYTQND